jgi:hypothetical protein
MNKSKQTSRSARRVIENDDALNDSLTKWFVRGNVRAHPKFENLLSSNTWAEEGACFRGAYHIMKMIDNVSSESSLIQHLVPGFTGIVAEGGAGKTTVAKAIFEVLSSSDKSGLDVDVSYLSMGEPESSVSYSMEALLDLIYKKGVADPTTLNVIIVDSLKNFWSDPILNVSGATASGAVNTASYQALSELTTLCLDANVMVIAVLNPLFVRLEDVVKAITSSLSAVWRITTNPGASDLTINGLSRVPIYDKRQWTSVDKTLAPSLLVTKRTAFSFSLTNPVRSADEESHWEREILSWFPGSSGDKPFGG